MSSYKPSKKKQPKETPKLAPWQAKLNSLLSSQVTPFDPEKNRTSRVIRREHNKYGLKTNASRVRPHSVTEFASDLKMQPAALVAQLSKAGIVKNSVDEYLSESEKARLLSYLRGDYKNSKPIQPMSVYEQHPEHEELRLLISNIKRLEKWMDGWRWGSLTASRRAAIRCLVSDDFPELIRAYDWLTVLGSGYHDDRPPSPVSTDAKVSIPSLDTPGNAPGMGKPIRRKDDDYVESVDDDADVAPLAPNIVSSASNTLSVSKPIGVSKPKAVSATTVQYSRDTQVKDWILSQAKGVCECCSKPAPFKGTDGAMYLEVHHVRQLAEEGSDTIDNTVALCPNCHRELHYGVDREKLVDRLYQSIGRLVRRK